MLFGASKLKDLKALSSVTRIFPPAAFKLRQLNYENVLSDDEN